MKILDKRHARTQARNYMRYNSWPRSYQVVAISLAKFSTFVLTCSRYGYVLPLSRTLSRSRTGQHCYHVPEPATQFYNQLSHSRTGQAHQYLGLGFRFTVQDLGWGNNNRYQVPEQDKVLVWDKTHAYTVLACGVDTLPQRQIPVCASQAMDVFLGCSDELGLGHHGLSSIPRVHYTQNRTAQRGECTYSYIKKQNAEINLEICGILVEDGLGLSLTPE